PLRQFLPAWLRPLFDLASPFGAPGALEMNYATQRRGGALIVEGTSRARMRDGRPLVASTAQLTPHAGPVRMNVRVRSREYAIDLDPTQTRSPARAEAPALTGGIAHVQR
ncbi:MAG: hypothetical protein WCJ30_04075, partial [Deltaproteobacteria bacterium]